MRNQNLYQIYLINLDRATERLNSIVQEFKNQHLNYERIPAVDARNLEQEKYSIQNKYDRDLLSGEIACFLSHIKTLKTFLASDFEFAIIIEDDARLADNFDEIISKTLHKYNSLALKHQWDVLKLVNGKRHHILVDQIDEQYRIGACGTSIPITTMAAVWTRKGAQKYLEKINPEKPIIKRPIDCDLQHAWEYDLRIYNLLPSIVYGSDAPTQIVKADDNVRKANFTRQITYEWNRLLPKYYYYINHHGWQAFYQSFIAKKNPKIK